MWDRGNRDKRVKNELCVMGHEKTMCRYLRLGGGGGGRQEEEMGGGGGGGAFSLQLEDV